MASDLDPLKLPGACAVVSPELKWRMAPMSFFLVRRSNQPYLPFHIAIVKSLAIIIILWNTDGDEWSRTAQDLEFNSPHRFVRWLYLRDWTIDSKFFLEDKVQFSIIRKQKGRSSWYEWLVLMFFYFTRPISFKLFQICLFWPTLRLTLQFRVTWPSTYLSGI